MSLPLYLKLSCVGVRFLGFEPLVRRAQLANHAYQLTATTCLIGRTRFITINSGSAVALGTTTGAANITARGIGTGTGGSVSVSGYPVSVNAPILVTGGSSNGSGGDITLTSLGTGSSGILTITTTLSTSALGSGTAGDINLKGDSFSISGVMLTANGGTTGTGGLVALTSTGTTDLAISGNGSVIEALGGTTSGNGGTVNITTSAALTIGAGTKVLTTAVSGIGGPITLSATSSIYGAISISGAVHADGSTGGKVVVTAGNQAAFSDLTFATGAFLTADSTGSGTTGSVTVSTATANELDITGAGTLSALNGTVTLSQPGQNVVVNVGSLIGNIVSTANSISLTDSSNTTPFTLKQLNATMSSITLTKTGSGNIVSSGSSETVQAIGTSNTTGSLSVTMNQGYFGVAGVPILTQVESTSFNTSGASANVVIQNTDAGKSDGSTITGSVGGSLTYTTSGLFQVLLQAELSAGGNITLQGGKINLENLSDVTAKGNVAFSIGRAAQASCSQINIMPPCATPLHTMPTITSPGNIYWGTNGISANGGTITVVANGQTITFDSNGPAGNIFGGASTIHAGN